jgi:hypothetical protein
MTASEEQKERDDPIQVGLSHEEAESLRALFRSSYVAEVDSLARLRVGKLIANVAYQPPKRGW